MTKKIDSLILLVSLICLVFLPGHSETFISASANGIEIGMSEIQVEKSLGAPVRSSRQHLHNIGKVDRKIFLNSSKKEFEVWLSEGAVMAVLGEGCNVTLNGSDLSSFKTLKELKSFMKPIGESKALKMTSDLLFTDWQLQDVTLTCVSRSDGKIEKWILERL